MEIEKQILAIGREGSYFVKENSDLKNKYTEKKRYNQDARVHIW